MSLVDARVRARVLVRVCTIFLRDCIGVWAFEKTREAFVLSLSLCCACGCYEVRRRVCEAAGAHSGSRSLCQAVSCEGG